MVKRVSGPDVVAIVGDGEVYHLTGDAQAGRAAARPSGAAAHSIALRLVTVSRGLATGGDLDREGLSGGFAGEYLPALSPF